MLWLRIGVLSQISDQTRDELPLIGHTFNYPPPVCVGLPRKQIDVVVFTLRPSRGRSQQDRRQQHLRRSVQNTHGHGLSQKQEKTRTGCENTSSTTLKRRTHKTLQTRHTVPGRALNQFK